MSVISCPRPGIRRLTFEAKPLAAYLHDVCQGQQWCFQYADLLADLNILSRFCLQTDVCNFDVIYVFVSNVAFNPINSELKFFKSAQLVLILAISVRRIFALSFGGCGYW